MCRTADVLKEWLCHLVTLGPPSCHHLKKKLKTSSGEPLAIELSPNSSALHQKAARSSSSSGHPMSSEELSKYESCLRSRMQNVSAAEKKLNKMVAKEIEEQRVAEEKARKERELQEQAKRAEKAKEAAARKQTEQLPTPARARAAADPEVVSEFNGCPTHSCRWVVELLDYSSFGVDDLERELPDPVASPAVCHCNLGVDGDDEFPTIAVHLLRSIPTLVTTRAMKSDANFNVINEFRKPWLMALIERANNANQGSSVISLPDNQTMAGFLFAGDFPDQVDIQRLLTPLDGLAKSAQQWSQHKNFEDPLRAQALKMMKSVLVQLHTSSYFCGAYDMLAGRVLLCLQGARLVAGLPIRALFHIYQKCQGQAVPTIAQLASWMKTSCSLEHFVEHGFYVLLQESAVLVVPPGFFIVELSLGVDAVTLSYPVMPLHEHYEEGLSQRVEDVHKLWHSSADGFTSILPPDAASSIKERVNALQDLLCIRAIKQQKKNESESESSKTASVAVRSSNNADAAAAKPKTIALQPAQKDLQNLYNETLQRLNGMEGSHLKSLVEKACVHPLLSEYKASVIADDPGLEEEWSFGQDDGLTDLADFCHFLRKKGLNAELLLSPPMVEPTEPKPNAFAAAASGHPAPQPKELEEFFNQTMQRLAKLDEHQIKCLVGTALTHPLVSEFEAAVLADDPNLSEWHFGENDPMTDLACFCNFLRKKGLDPKGLLELQPLQPQSQKQQSQRMGGLRITARPARHTDTAKTNEQNTQQTTGMPATNAAKHTGCPNTPDTSTNTAETTAARTNVAQAEAKTSSAEAIAVEQLQYMQQQEQKQTFSAETHMVSDAAAAPTATTTATEGEPAAEAYSDKALPDERPQETQDRQQQGPEQACSAEVHAAAPPPAAAAAVEAINAHLAASPTEVEANARPGEQPQRSSQPSSTAPETSAGVVESAEPSEPNTAKAGVAQAEANTEATASSVKTHMASDAAAAPSDKKLPHERPQETQDRQQQGPEQPCSADAQAAAPAAAAAVETTNAHLAASSTEVEAKARPGEQPQRSSQPSSTAPETSAGVVEAAEPSEPNTAKAGVAQAEAKTEATASSVKTHMASDAAAAAPSDTTPPHERPQETQAQQQPEQQHTCSADAQAAAPAAAVAVETTNAHLAASSTEVEAKAQPGEQPQESSPETTGLAEPAPPDTTASLRTGAGVVELAEHPTATSPQTTASTASLPTGHTAATIPAVPDGQNPNTAAGAAPPNPAPPAPEPQPQVQVQTDRHGDSEIPLEPWHVRKARFFNTSTYHRPENQEKQQQMHAQALAKAADMAKSQHKANAAAAAAEDLAKQHKKAS